MLFKKRPTVYHCEGPGGDVYDLFKDPLEDKHVLIAGASGSGKSVFLSGILTTALHFPPVDVPGGKQLILIDKKRVELIDYAKAPHCLLYACDDSTIESALRTACAIIEQRYIKMQQSGKKLYSGSDVYIVFDEFADTALSNKKAVFPLVQRISQIGRAARVHIILATQVPLAKVIPTEIKANFDSIIGLHTRSAQDSRNIIGRAGLETLPMFGQCVYIRPGKPLECFRVPLTPQEETAALLQWWSDPAHFRKANRQERKKK